MQALKIVLFSVSVALIESNSSTTEENPWRIANGDDFIPEKYPYVVGFLGHLENSSTICTGTLVTALFVLTAAHCTDGLKASNITVNHVV
jgi:secreted trypsin-like serine protease